MGENDKTNPVNKWKIKEAKDICLSVIDKYKNTYGASLCAQLLNQINRKHIAIDVEKVNLPNENLLINLSYKNINKLYFRLSKISPDELERYRKTRDKQFDFVKHLPVYRHWNVDLPDDGDYRQHTVEAGIDPLEIGTYVLMSATNDRFEKDNGIVSYQFLHISRLAFWAKNVKNNNATLVYFSNTVSK